MTVDTKQRGDGQTLASSMGGLALKHGMGAMSAGGISGRRLRLHDIMEDSSPSVYVLSHATRLTKKVAHILIPHKSSQSGDTFTIEIPSTFIPIDLANYAPKEELIRNPTLMHSINMGLLTLLKASEAEKILEEPASIAEMNRIIAANQKRMSSTMANEGEDNGPMRATLNPAAAPPPGAPGDIDTATAGVQATVTNLFNSQFSDDDRYVMLRNLEPTLTDDDRRYIRSKTNDARLREIVG